MFSSAKMQAADDQKQKSVVPPADGKKTMTILSIDGGGIRGIIPAIILSFLEEELQRLDDNKSARIVDYFDVIAGTSTGGIVTAMLSTPAPKKSDEKESNNNNQRPLPAKDMIDFYSSNGPKIFSEEAKSTKQILSNWSPSALKNKLKAWAMVGYPGMWLWAFLKEPKYDGKHLHSAVKKYYNDWLLSQTLTNVVIPAYDMQEMRPIVFSSQQAKEKSLNIKLKDVVLGTSAAPAFFPSHKVKADGKQFFLVHGEHPAVSDDENYHLVDGGLSANNPTLLAIREATKILEKENAGENSSNYTQINYNDFLVLSLGTASAEKRIRHEISDGGFWDWVLDIKRRLSPLFEVIFMASSDMIKIYTSLILGNCKARENYLRIEGSMKAEAVKIDDASPGNLKLLKEIGNNILYVPDDKSSPDKKLKSSSDKKEKPKELTETGKALVRFAEKLCQERKRRLSSCSFYSLV